MQLSIAGVEHAIHTSPIGSSSENVAAPQLFYILLSQYVQAEVISSSLYITFVELKLNDVKPK